MTSDIEISTNKGSSEPLAADKVVFSRSINSYTTGGGSINFIPA
jgi:hypothetical protein